MNETLLFINVFIFIITLVSLILPYKYQVNAFTLLSASVLCYFSAQTFMVITGLSLVVFLLCKQKMILASYAAIALTLGLFITIQTQLNQLNVAVIGAIYMVCRQIHYIVESKKNHFTAITLWQYLRYQLFIPCLVAGPIHRIDHFEKQLRRRHFQWQQLSDGLELLLIGHFKVIVIGLFIEKILLESLPVHISAGLALSLIVSLTQFFKLYILFSGYTDIAKGFAKLLGIEIPDNFNKPLSSVNISDFWQRWHITLSNWCKDYVFTPAFASSRSLLVATILSMIIIGLWHEFSWRYVLWGVYHGMGIFIFRWYSSRVSYNLPKLLATSLTILFVASSYEITYNLNNWLKTII
tara:strand:- start:5426 stop:6484 length:1059 start_codon:yes stop_codon:yes gene_type:complete